MMESIVKSLSKYGEVKVTNAFNYELLDWCDVLVIGGGTLVSKRSLGGHDLALYAKEKGKKIIYYSQTIEEGHPKFKEHLALADLITVRDSASKKIVEANGFRAILASDPVFEKRKRRIGFSFRRWFDEPLGIEDKLASVLDHLAIDYEMLSLPYTENDTDTESDKAFHETVIQRMIGKPLHASFNEAIEKVDLFIGMRLHALIEALNIGKKVIAIDYDAKVGRIFSDLSMEDMVVSYDHLDQIPFLARNKIFRANGLALREKANEALIAKICADIKGEPSPKVSVVLTTYNRAKYLKEAIDSIIKQGMQDWELIIVDDGSTDHTKALVSSYSDLRIKYYNFGHNGESFSRNIGNLISRGDIIVVADAETISLPNRLEVICRELEKTGADILYSSMFYLDSDGKMERMPSQPFLYERLKETNFIYHPTVTYRREVAMKCPYDEESESFEDYSMYFQAVDKGYKFHSIEEQLVMHQLHDRQSLSSKGSGTEKGAVPSYKLTSPMVSVIIPTRNRPGFLKEALESVLSQTYKNYEIIVVDDGGEDVSEMINSLDHGGKIIYLRHEDGKGPSATRNTGLKVAKGKYIAYLDDDDIYYPTHLETLIPFLERSNYKVAYSDSYQASQTWITDRYVITDKKIKYNFDFDRQKFLVCNYIHIISIVHRRELLDEVGLFDEKLETHEDWDLCVRLSQACDFYHIPKATVEFRVRDDMTNAITSKSESLFETLKLIHKRYSHLVSQNEIFQEQKKIERTLEAKAEISRWHKSFLQYTPLHFYRLGKEFVKGKKVLDLECSKGHGSFLLAEDAGSVIALDENERSIRYASCHFIKENLVFKKGSLLDQSREGQALFDVIIWFRSMSNITELEKQLPMIHRFLKEGGIFLVSLPNKRNDLSSLNYPLGYRSSLNEFKSLLNKYFEYTLMYGQKIYPSSNIFPLFNTSESSREYLVEKGEENFLFVSPERKEAEYFIAVASNQPLENVAADSYLIDASECLFKFKEAQIKSLEEELCDKEAHIRNLEDEVRRKDIYIKDLEVTVEAKGKEISKLESNIESILKEKDRYIESLREAMDSKDKYAKDLERNLESIVPEKDRYIESLKEAMDSKDKYAKDLERNLESIIPEKDKYIESLKEAIGNRDKYTQDLEATLESKVNEILKLQNYIESMIKEKDRYIESLKEAMDSKDKYAKDLERNLESIIPEKDKYIESLLNALDGKAKEVADLNTSIAQKNEDIERLNSELNALKNMVIYRLLKKFRFVKM